MSRRVLANFEINKHDRRLFHGGYCITILPSLKCMHFIWIDREHEFPKWWYSIASETRKFCKSGDIAVTYMFSTSSSTAWVLHNRRSPHDKLLGSTVSSWHYAKMNNIMTADWFGICQLLLWEVWGQWWGRIGRWYWRSRFWQINIIAAWEVLSVLQRLCECQPPRCRTPYLRRGRAPSSDMLHSIPVDPTSQFFLTVCWLGRHLERS